MPTGTHAALVVVDDAGYGVPTHRVLFESGIKKLISKPYPWFLFKVSGDISRLSLWKVIARIIPQQTVIVLNVRDLRATAGVQIALGLSWERTTQDIIYALQKNPKLKVLWKRCHSVIVSLNTSGAVLISQGQPTKKDAPTNQRTVTLFYDHRHLEGDWEIANWGRMMGYTTTLTASVVLHLMRFLRKKDYDGVSAALINGITGGIDGMRELYRSGYVCQCAKCEDSNSDIDGYKYQNPQSPVTNTHKNASPCPAGSPTDADESPLLAVRIHSPALIFPVKNVAKYLSSYHSDGHSICQIGVFENESRAWSILRSILKSGEQNAIEIAMKIAEEGLGTQTGIIDIPSLEIGNLQTVDRSEIEALRGIQGQIREYASRTSHSMQPLNFAVFGPPGSGKSFGVEQIARSLTTKIEMRTFNMSQFTDVNEFDGALHQVRDIGLSGVLPVIFWDEFDTKLGNNPLGWLRYFLAPMQDGQFFEQGITHTIGRSIFVFAGGIHACMDDFRSIEDIEVNTNDLTMKWSVKWPLPATRYRRKREAMRIGTLQFSRDAQDVEHLKNSPSKRDAKVPDFVSRLAGYINVSGINPLNEDTGGADYAYIIRRAILLRSLLYQHAPLLFPHRQTHPIRGHDTKGILKIDLGLLKAFLTTRQYIHNTRSLRAIINCSHIAGKRHFDRSDLPAKTLLDIHIDTSDFAGILMRS